MIGVLDRCLLFVLDYIIILRDNDWTRIVGYSLIGIIFIGLSFYFFNKKESLYEEIGYGVIAIIVIFVPGIASYLSICIYSLFAKYGKYIKNNHMQTDTKKGLIYKYVLISDIFPILIAIICAGLKSNMITALLLSCSIMLGAFMGYKTGELTSYISQNKRLRDDSIEKNRVFEMKNKYLGENQEKEVYIATLRERNRIAREIHDNVGHILSRSILQLGAILAINKGTPTEKQLIPVKDTLDEAMNSIRESVHDLHKESFDIKQASSELIKEIDNFDIHFECDITVDANKNVKYAFLTILKEALTNITRHCNGDKVWIYMRELEDYYQMVVEDNGSEVVNIGNLKAGIGLKNMEDRVKQLKGIITFSGTKGFRIFISIPKEENKKEIISWI